MKNILITAITLLGSSLSFAQVERNVGEFTQLKVYDKIPVELISSLKNKLINKTPLIIACKNGSILIVKTLLENGSELKQSRVSF